MVLLNGIRQPRRPPVPRRRPLRHPPRDRPPPELRLRPPLLPRRRAGPPRGPGRARRGAAALPRVGGRLGQREDGAHVDGARAGSRCPCGRTDVLLELEPRPGVLPRDDREVPRRATRRSTSCGGCATTRSASIATTGSGARSSAGRRCSSPRRTAAAAISGDGVVDLTLIAHEFGHAAAPGPFVPTNVVAAALSDAGAHLDVVADLVAGTSIASWCVTEPPPHDHLGAIALDIRADGGDLVLNGVKRPVESAADGRPPPRHRSHRATGSPRCSCHATRPASRSSRCDTVDLTRRFSLVRFDDVRVPATASSARSVGADAASRAPAATRARDARTPSRSARCSAPST